MFSLGPLKGRLHPAGYPFVCIFMVLCVFGFMANSGLGVGAVFLTFFCAAFFREPLRSVPADPGVLVSPADGLVVDIQKINPPKELGAYGEGSWQRISVFLSVFDVHVNRIPEEGRVLMTAYHKGKFLNAAADKASDVNERNSVVLETTFGNVIITQIAGLIARRIVCDVSIGDNVKRGDTFGIIRFGSRVDLYVSAKAKIMARKGQRMVGGETVMASFRETKSA